MPLSLRRREAIVRCAILASCSAMLGGGVALAQGWPVAGGDPAHAGSAEGPAPPYRTSWRLNVPGAGLLSAPVVVGDTGVVVAPEKVVAFDPADGSLLWEVPREPGPVTPAALGQDLALVTEGRGEEGALVALSLEDGTERWRASVDRPGIAAPTVAGERAYVATAGGEVRAFDLVSGDAGWTFVAEGRIATAPAVGAGLVVVAAEDFREGIASVQAIDETKGTQSWRFAPSGVSLGVSAATIDEDAVTVGLGDFRIRSLSQDSGAERWATRVRSAFSPRSAPARAQDLLVVTDRVGHIHGLDAVTGRERWVYRVTGHLLDAAPALTAGVAIVGDATGQASAISLDTGHLVWRTDLGAGPVAGPAVTPDRVIFTCCGDRIVGVEADPGARLLDEASPTTLFPGRALLNFALAALPIFAGVLLLLRVAPMRWVDPRGASGEETPAAEETEEPGGWRER